MLNPEKAWEQNWQREMEGAYLYGGLAGLTQHPELKQALNQMAEQETRHASVWSTRVREANPNGNTPQIDLRIRLTLLMARWFGVESVMGLLINDEVSDIASYTDQAMQLGDISTYQDVVRDETSHARALAAIRSRGKDDTRVEPWHRGANVGGLVRDMVYGFNDGLTANFGLVMGVVGASVSNQFLLLTGFAGLMADALSMAASGFLASRSEQEVLEHHLSLERAELELMPKEEREELVGFYVQKGLTRQEASTVADRLMANPDVALTQLAREELGIDPEAPGNPLREGVVTGIATGVGAVIPILPFLFLKGSAAVWLGILISMVAHFLVGASRAVFTGRPAIRSGIEMFLVGMGVALATYLLGMLVGVRL
jgi:VIT1/CCC1 family predicted Fe2+/Mn2+ transporter